MALSGKSRKYKVKKVTNWSNNTSDVVIYSMITPSGGETTPPNYIRAFNTLTQLKTATSSAYMSELDVFLNKCGLTPSQITSFKSNAEVNDPSSCPTCPVYGTYSHTECGGTYLYDYYHNGSCGYYSQNTWLECNPSCLPAGSMILLSDGSLKGIEHIMVGDAVVSYDIQGLDKDNETAEYITNWKTGTLQFEEVVATVVEVKEATVQGLFVFNDTLKSSSSHAHFIHDGTDYRFMKSYDVKTGMSLVKQDGTMVIIDKIEFVKEPTLVYEINVEDYDVYTAEGFITHNPAMKEV